MKQDLFEHIIIKFLEGHATSHEKGMLRNWLKEDPQHEEIFYYQLTKWEIAHPQYMPEMDSRIAAYEKFLKDGEMIQVTSYQRDQNHAPLNSRSGNYRWWLAASVILFLSAGLYMLNKTFFYKTYATQNRMIRSVMLQDSTVVTLNANSSIKVPRDWVHQESREVWITGEAFFEVTRKHSLSKFTVHTPHLDVEVLGTKFNVSNRRGTTEVMLDEGKVKLIAKDKKELIMNPGEQVVISDEQRHFQKQIVRTEKYSAWRFNKLVFENTPLAEVAQIIYDYYGVTVTINDPLLAERQFTGTLPNKDLNVILLALTTAYKIEIEQHEENITLKRKD